MKFHFIITLLILASCSGGSSKNPEKSAEQPDNSPKEKKAQELETTVQDKPKTELQLLMEDGLVIADSSEDCSSQRWEADPRTKLVINYPQGSKLILEEWTYSIEDDELRLLDFHIYDCQTSSVLLEAKYTTADYKIIDVSPSLKIQINADIPTLNDGYSRQPFIIKTFNEIDSTITTQVEKIFEIPELSNDEINRIETEFNLRPTLDEGTPRKTGDFATDVLLIKLFRGTVNENTSAKNMFINIREKYALDGSIGELYGDLKYLLIEAEK